MRIEATLDKYESERLDKILKETNRTVYNFTKDAVLELMRKIEGEGPQYRSTIVDEMLAALRERKWTLYQMDDFSDHNHREWLSGRFPKASKNEVKEAVAIFRMRVSQ